MNKQVELPKETWTIKDIIIIFIIWFFLTGFYEMTHQLVFEDSPFLTQSIHYLFFITIRLLFIPIAIYLFCFRTSRSVQDIGLTLDKISKMLKIGLKVSWPLMPMTLFLIHLPLVYTEANLRPMYEATSPDKIAISLVFFIILFFMSIIPSLAEEVLFRGITFTFLSDRYSKWQALFVNALLYAFFYSHFDIYHLGIRFTLGFFTTYLYWKTENLIPSTILMASFHASMILYVFGWGYW